jgi:Flp pilus assembly protein TadB
VIQEKASGQDVTEEFIDVEARIRAHQALEAQFLEIMKLFGRELREAVADSISVATGILLFLVRFVIVMIPVFLLIILPGILFVRYLVRRLRRLRLARELQSVPNSE